MNFHESSLGRIHVGGDELIHLNEDVAMRDR